MTDIKDPENTIILDTTKGEVVIEMRPDLAPNHCARIKELVSAGFYDGTPFHRVIDSFMAQGGDPTGTGTGGSGKHLDAEFNSEPHVRGVCSMARVLHLLCRCNISGPPVYRLGQGHFRNGQCRFIRPW